MQKNLFKILSILIIIALLIAIILFYQISHQEKLLEVNYFDVGQGDASLIETPFGQNILIDGGPDDTVIRRLSKSLSLWDRTIDLMILTHPHSDHVTGLIDVIKRYDVKQIIYTGVIHNSPTFLTWLDLVREKNIPVNIIEHPQRINLGDDCFLDVLYPDKSYKGKSVDNLNNTSIVFNLVYHDTKFLFTGDIEEEAEEYLVNSGSNIQTNILKVAHHGSNTSTINDFLDSASPEIAFISVGIDNQFNHPSETTLNKLKNNDIKIYRSDKGGSLVLESDGIKIYKK